MGKGRLEAFSDGVIAILITIMVLELKLPPGSDLAALRTILPMVLMYLLSFAFLGIYWNNHHHMLHATDRINGTDALGQPASAVLAVAGPVHDPNWMGERHFAALPTALYGVVLLCAALAYTILQGRIIAVQGPRSKLALAVQGDVKGKISLAAYLCAIPLAFVSPWISGALYVGVALIWLVPDRRIETVLAR